MAQHQPDLLALDHLVDNVGALRGWLYRNGFSAGITRHGVQNGDVIPYDYHSDGGWDHSSMITYRAQTPQVFGNPSDYPLVTQHGDHYIYDLHTIRSNKTQALRHITSFGANQVQ